MLLDLLKMHLNMLFQALFLLAPTPKLLFPKFFLFFFLWRREQHQLLILREVLFGHDILEEQECLDHVFRRLSTSRRSGWGEDLPPLPREGLLAGAPHVAHCLWWAAQSWVLSEEHDPKDL